MNVNVTNTKGSNTQAPKLGMFSRPETKFQSTRLNTQSRRGNQAIKMSADSFEKPSSKPDRLSDASLVSMMGMSAVAGSIMTASMA